MSDDLQILAEALKYLDLKKLPHGLEPYRRFGPRTVRAILAVRDHVTDTPHLAQTKFRIGMTADPTVQEAAERAAGCVKFAAVHESMDLDEIRNVEADVRLYYLWHFPGRCLNKGDYRQENLKPGFANFVYVACFAPIDRAASSATLDLP